MGFGHRVYKNFDPRAKILEQTADKVLAKLGVDDPLLDIAEELASIALTDEYFLERKLYPNVDFYCGIIMRAIGIPLNMFTVMFAIGRDARLDRPLERALPRPDRRIGRPRQIYTGPTQRDYVPIDKPGVSRSGSTSATSLGMRGERASGCDVTTRAPRASAARGRLRRGSARCRTWPTGRR